MLTPYGVSICAFRLQTVLQDNWGRGFPPGRPEIGGEAVAPVPVEKGYDQSVRSAAFGPGPKRYSMLESTG
jgi:hypothetical protein